jgi:hypothetical protein
MVPGCQAPIAAAPGAATLAADPISDAVGAAGSPLESTAATGAGLSELPLISRRAAAAAAHTSGAAAGESPLPPAPSHDHNELLNPDAGATRAAVITGADATAGAATSTAGSATGTPESLPATTESDTCGTGETDSGAGEFDPMFTAGGVAVRTGSRRDEMSGTVAPD